MHIQEYGNKHNVGGDFGFIYEPFKNWKLGGHVYNLAPIPLEKEFKEHIPTIIRLGTSYQPSEKVLLSAEFEERHRL